MRGWFAYVNSREERQVCGDAADLPLFSAIVYWGLASGREGMEQTGKVIHSIDAQRGTLAGK
jgi:hypothetical protein